MIDLPSNFAGLISASWTLLLNGIKQYADDIGDREIDGIISILPILDQSIASGDHKALLYNLKKSIAYTVKMLPHITNPVIREEYSEKMAALQPMMVKIAMDGDMTHLHSYIVNSGKQGSKDINEL